MNLPNKVFLAATLVCVVVFEALGQMELNQNSILTIRSATNAAKLTEHYGDLNVTGGNQGLGSGYLYANQTYLYDGAYIYGNLKVFGNISGNIKSFIHPHPTEEDKIIRYIAIESGEALTIARGTAKTVKGEAVVVLPEHFSMTTSPNTPVTVILTPKGAPVLLYTKQDNREKIVVAMKNSDLTTFGDVEFAFQVTGVRDGFEKMDVIMDAKKFHSPDFKDGWENTEVGKRIKAYDKRVMGWHEKEKEERYKNIDK